MQRAPGSSLPPKDGAARTDVASLEFQASLVRAINEASPDGILVVDETDTVVSHNRRFIEVWGMPAKYRDGSAIGKSDQPVLAMAVERVKSPETFLARVKELYANPALEDHCEIELKDGRTLERHSTVLRNEHGKYLGRVWFFRDITEHKRTEAILQDMAEHDSLTGVANRRYFFARAAQELARARRSRKPVALILIDIDHFKNINDQHGHAVGDEVLQSLCRNWIEVLREIDVLGRLGGEEFAILLPDTNLDGARTIAERLRQSVEQQRIRTDKWEIGCTISAGVTTMHEGETAVDPSLHRADEALYAAKGTGRNRVEVNG